MKMTRLAALTFAGLLCSSALPAFADDSTGPTNPAAKGTNPAAVGVPSGTDATLPNRNVDGSTAPRNGTSSDVKPQDTGNPEGSSMGGSSTKPDASKGDGHGSDSKN